MIRVSPKKWFHFLKEWFDNVAEVTTEPQDLRYTNRWVSSRCYKPFSSDCEVCESVHWYGDKDLSSCCEKQTLKAKELFKVPHLSRMSLNLSWESFCVESEMAEHKDGFLEARLDFCFLEFEEMIDEDVVEILKLKPNENYIFVVYRRGDNSFSFIKNAIESDKEIYFKVININTEERLNLLKKFSVTLNGSFLKPLQKLYAIYNFMNKGLRKKKEDFSLGETIEEYELVNSRLKEYLINNLSLKIISLERKIF